MQYNVENLFDGYHEPGKKDEDFTPEGRYQWTQQKLQLKLDHLSQVIMSIHTPLDQPDENGQNEILCPDVLTLAEVKNTYVLKLWNEGALAPCHYNKIITDDRDPDPRGIQVAILSRLDLMSRPLSHKVYAGGRFIEEAVFQIDNHPLYIFANHWKSRLRRPPDTDGGESKRIKSAEILRKRLNEIFADTPEADVAVMGDLNDEPENKSISESLGVSLDAQKVIDSADQELLWESSANLLSSHAFDNVDDDKRDDLFKFLRSTFYYAREKAYNQLDHILLSKGLFDTQGFSYEPNSFQVVRYAPFTSKPLNIAIPFDVKINDAGEDVGVKGASDHFPVVVRLHLNEE